MSSKTRDKYSSPPPHAASVTTPPPSNSQPISYPPARTPTPTHSHLSSPPPTIKASTKRRVMDNESLSQSSDQDMSSSVPELRSMLAQAQEECRLAKTSAAHHRLQYKMLKIEADETQNRKDVELNMLRHELDILRRSKDIRVAPGSPSNTSNDLRKKTNFLEVENARLRHRLQDAKSYIVESEATRTHETSSLRKRIRQNREHFHLLSRTGALFGEVLPHTKPHEAPQVLSPPKSRTDDAFSQLLLADQVLSQGTASTPATPHAARQRGHAAYHRPAHSLTSLPSTPLRSAFRPDGPYYLPGQTSAARPAQSPMRSTLQRRRESRDSTISASDEERVPGSHIPIGISDDEGDEVHVEAGDAVTASHASMEAVNMLRRSASNSFHGPSHHQQDMNSPPPGSHAARAPMQAPMAPMSAKQSMMYGYQIRPGGGAGQESIKRRFYDEGVEKEGRARKKGRVGSGPREREREREGLEQEGVGLGIGGWR